VKRLVRRLQEQKFVTMGAKIAAWTILLQVLYLFSRFANGSLLSKRALNTTALNTTEIAHLALTNAYKVLEGTLSDGITHKKCTKHNVAVRREL
jgi:hypothetical protein